jgi:hypothetical protein
MYFISKYFECKCIWLTNKKEKSNINTRIKTKININDFSQKEYDKTMSQVCQLKQKLLGKRIKNI